MARAALKGARIVLLYVALAAIAYAVILLPALDEMDAALGLRAQLVTTYVDVSKVVRNRDAYRAQLVELKSSLAAMKAMIPNADGVEVRVAPVEASIQRAAAAAGVELVSVAFADSVPSDFYSRRRVTVRASGDFSRISDFVQRLSTASEELRTVVRAIVQPNTDRPGILLSAEVDAYGYVTEEVARQRHRAAQQARGK